MTILSRRRSILTTLFSPIALLALTIPATAAPIINLPAVPDAELRVGANIRYEQTPYDTDGGQFKILPGVFYDNNKVYARGNTFGAYILNDGTHQLDAFVQVVGSSFDPEDANGALAGLDERKLTGMTGLSYLQRTPIGGLRAQIATDIAGRSDGSIARLSYLAKFSDDKLTVYPSVGVEWNDSKYNDYYFGISETEAAKTGLPSYSPGASINPYISVSGMYDFNDQWAGFASQSFDHLSSKQYNSPMVKTDSHFDSKTTLGLLYKF
ncbi:MipA/OmpV family protein [Psychrobacter pygoscelis]|uniref:MipA/OmpV family protein n=1 Tax=Psychrobacter pygoscelis TaxID=2488563 RepID=UPI00103CBB6D|nr:MipA/OmpV family protein [Psychrobacter pygoscelis]